MQQTTKTLITKPLGIIYIQQANGEGNQGAIISSGKNATSALKATVEILLKGCGQAANHFISFCVSSSIFAEVQ